MARELGAMLAKMSEAKRQDWASTKLAEITDRHVKALDIMGWRLVYKDDPSYRWPFDVNEAGCPAPEWCDAD